MTKTKKTIMWATIACLLVVGVAGGAVGVTYSRYASSGTGTGSAAVAYWDVAVTPTDSANVSLKASPEAAEWGGESGTYSSDYVRSTTSEAILAATLTNSGNVGATVTVEQTGTLGYTFRDVYEENSDYLAAIPDHFAVILFTAEDENGTNLTELGGSTTLAANQSLYIFCELVWTSDIESCFGDAADAFDSYIGTNVASIDFTLSYSAVQAATSSETQP